MKKALSLAGLFIVGLTLSAQTSLSTAVDFTATDTDGNQHTLFDYLNEGKYVMIDFFFTT